HARSSSITWPTAPWSAPCLADDDHLRRDVGGMELAVDPVLARLLRREAHGLGLVGLDDTVDVVGVDAEAVILVGVVVDADVDLVAFGDGDRPYRERRGAVDDG